MSERHVNFTQKKNTVTFGGRLIRKEGEKKKEGEKRAQKKVPSTEKKKKEGALKKKKEGEKRAME